MSLKYKKIYIDTRYKTSDSKSTSDFKINLPESISFESNTCFYIDDITIPHSWTSIEDFNNKLYLYVSEDGDPDDKYSFIITVSNGNYTGADFAIELQNKIRTATNSINTNMFSVSYNIRNNYLTISTGFSGYSYKILTPKDLTTGLNNTFISLYDKTNPNDINEVLSNLEGNSAFYSVASPYISGFLNFQPINNMYLHSGSIGTYNSLSANGDQTVIKKIPVTQDYGVAIHDQCVLFNDFNNCSNQSIRLLEFQLKTARGDLIPLHGCNINFSLIFTRADTSV